MNKPIDWDLNSALIGCMAGLFVAALILILAEALIPDRIGERVWRGGYVLLLLAFTLAIDIVMMAVNL